MPKIGTSGKPITDEPLPPDHPFAGVARRMRELEEKRKAEEARKGSGGACTEPDTPPTLTVERAPTDTHEGA